MDFKSTYETNSKIKLSCRIPYRIQSIMTGSGGSMNIVVRLSLPGKKHLILKIMPQTLYYNVKRQPDFDKLEIKFYRFFTDKYLLTNRTPHIVGTFGSKHCPNIKKFMTTYILNKPCTTPAYLLENPTKSNSVSDIEEIICDILLRHEMKLIRPDFFIISLENCTGDLSDLLQNWIVNIFKLKKSVTDFISELERILFQVIFTICIIKNDYPGYLHGDFFIRNVLYSKEGSHKATDVVAYHYKNFIFYLRANGTYAKINDFGMSVIVNKIMPNVTDPHADPRSHNNFNYNPFGKKTDIFNFLFDMYKHMIGFAQNLDLDSHIIKSIEKFMTRFIDIRVLKKFAHESVLDTIWHIDNLKPLTNTVSNPSTYLEQALFDKFLILNPKSQIIKHYNL